MNYDGKTTHGLSIRQAQQRREIMEQRNKLNVHDFITSVPSVARRAPHLGETSLGDVFDCLVWDDGTPVEMDTIIVSQ